MTSITTVRLFRIVFAVAVVVATIGRERPAAAQGLVHGWGFNAGGGFSDCAANGNPNSLCGQTGVPAAAVVTTPVPLNQVPDSLAIGAGVFHSLAIRADGTVWAWGNNGSGQLGSGGAAGAYSVEPVQVPGVADATAVAGGWHQSHAIRADGTLWSWGSAWTGVGSYSTRLPPTQVPGLEGVVAVAAGEASSHAVLSDGTLWSWGFNGTGLLGTGSFDSSALSPVRVTSLEDVVGVATHFVHALALRRDGTVWAWGSNSNGQLGDNTRVDRRTPVQVVGLTNIVQVAAGSFNSYALRNDGTVWTWGNHSGFDYLSPVPIGGLENVDTLAAGGSHLIARTTEGALLGWGDNSRGQLGAGYPSSFEWAPVRVAVDVPMSRVAAGRAHSLAVSADVTPPTISVPTDLVWTDATTPAGAVVTYSVTVADNADPAPALVCQPSSGSLFPQLWSTVQCDATDAAGNRSTATFDVLVKPADWQLFDLDNLIESWSLGKLGTSLVDKVNKARRFNEVGKYSQACDTLASLLLQVEAQIGKGLTVAQAADVTTIAGRIISVIGY